MGSLQINIIELSYLLNLSSGGGCEVDGSEHESVQEIGFQLIVIVKIFVGSLEPGH